MDTQTFVSRRQALREAVGDDAPPSEQIVDSCQLRQTERRQDVVEVALVAGLVDFVVPGALVGVTLPAVTRHAVIGQRP